MNTKINAQLAFISLFLILLNSCQLVDNAEVIEGSGVNSSEKKSFNSFERIEAKGEFTIVVTASDVFSATVISDGNILPHVEINMENGILGIQPEKGYKLKPSERINIIVQCPTLNAVSLSGAGSIFIDSLSADTNKSIDLVLNGAGEIGAKLYLEEIKASINGGGNITLKGKSDQTSIRIAGAGNVDTQRLESQKMKIQIDGGGDATVLALQTLNVVINGAGKVQYIGTPEVTKTINGAGSVNKIN